MIDCVVSVHRDPSRCGVTKFNHELARRLHVRHLLVSEVRDSDHPLWSFRVSEHPWWPDYVTRVSPMLGPAPYSLFFHDVPTVWDSRAADALRGADQVWAANAVRYLGRIFD